MVVPNPMAWLPDHHRRLDDAVGMLAFEAAAAMTRLLSLHRSLSDHQFLRLRSDTMRSQGVAYLNSTDQAFLLRLACAELISDLDGAAASVSRLGSRCRGHLLRSFDLVYSNLKAGSPDPSLVFKNADRTIRRTERLVAATEKLYAEMESLAELEAAERKMEERWSRHSGPIPIQRLPPPPPPGGGLLQQDLKSQRQRVRRLQEESLWSLSLDKAVGLMVRAAATVFARICIVFGPYVPGLPPVVVSKQHALLRFAPVHLRSRVYPRFPGKHSSGPMDQRVSAAKGPAVANSCPIIGPGRRPDEEAVGNWSKMLEPPAGTVGAAGMAVRYANVVVMAERLLSKEETASREELYGMLPVGMRAAVRGKMRRWWREERGSIDGSLAEGWREAVGRILGWLGPVAHDTVQWQAEHNMDRKLRFEARPRVLALQTLLFSDREKTEAAITEVLVGLSLAGWYDEGRRRPPAGNIMTTAG